VLASTAALGLAASAVAMSAPASAVPAAALSAQGAKKSDTGDVKVMTLNLYLGGSLGTVIKAISDGGDIAAILASANKLYDTVMKTNFPKRAKWIAKTIKKENPDVITLNELTRWVTTGALPSYDYLQILQKLKAQGMTFKVASLAENADIGLDINGAKNPVPYSGSMVPGCGAGKPACGWRLQDRDAVLYNAKTKNLKMIKGSAKSGHSKDQEVYEALGAKIDFDRGWAYAGFTFNGKKFTAATSHLEVESQDNPNATPGYGLAKWPSKIQVSQGTELVSVLKSAAKKTDGRVILAGDFNSDANGYYSPTYGVFTKWLADSWKQVGNKFGPGVGATCCQMGDLNSSLRLDSYDPTLPTRIDLVLSKKAEAHEAEILGTEKMQNQQPKWQSDHYFYAAHMHLK
jgi:endonuclease/exonuclease/phosphatase family metal-dependent hydrolase